MADSDSIYAAAAQRAIGRLDELASLSDEKHMISRSLLSKSNIRAAASILRWMEGFGMETAHTSDGSVRGVLGASGAGAKPLLLGSHFDTVPDAGKYDGPLGIVSALAALEVLKEEGVELSHPIHLLGFSDEEGSRFQTTYVGSRGMLGELDERTLAANDESGRSLAYVLATEGWNKGASEIRYQKEETLGYVELHIEQGRVLEDLGEPASAVSVIVGQTRLRLTLTGQADHAGTTPMDLRRDALAGAAEIILGAESIARENSPAVITVGKLHARPGAANAIPGEVEFTVDLRHPENGVRSKLHTELMATADGIAERRGLQLSAKTVLEDDATPCDGPLSELVLDAVEEVTSKRRSLLSGAGHDGVAMAAVAPIAMVLVRCREGISHQPDEHVEPGDIETGIRILTHFLKRLSEQQQQG